MTVVRPAPPDSPVSRAIADNALALAAALLDAINSCPAADAETARAVAAVFAAAADHGITWADFPASTVSGGVAQRFYRAVTALAASGGAISLAAAATAAGDPPQLVRKTLEGVGALSFHAQFHAAKMAEAISLSRLAALFDQLRDIAQRGDPIPAAAWDSLSRVREHSSPLRFASAAAILADDSPGGEEILPGLIHRGDVVMLAAPSKAGKTWFLLGLADALARGSSFAGLPAGDKPRRVAYIDGELEHWELRARLRALGVPTDGRGLEFLLMRGRAARPIDALPALQAAAAARAAFDLIVFDPFYSFESGRDENCASDMVSAMQELQRVAHSTAAAVIFAHHFSKGAKGSVAKADRASGSGVLARAVNDLITLSPHSAGEGYYLMEAVTRSFAPFAPRVLSFAWPRWEEAPEVEADAEGLVGAERKDGASVEEVAEEIAAKVRAGNHFSLGDVYDYANKRGARFPKGREIVDVLKRSDGVEWDGAWKYFRAHEDGV